MRMYAYEYIIMYWLCVICLTNKFHVVHTSALLPIIAHFIIGNSLLLYTGIPALLVLFVYFMIDSYNFNLYESYSDDLVLTEVELSSYSRN